MVLDDQPSQADQTPVDLSSNRTSMSFQRTRMSSDRTLMAIMRTALSLISFGFTIFSFFRALRASEAIPVVRAEAPRNFALALIFIGVAMLAMGIWNDLRFMRGLKEQRQFLIDEGLISGRDRFQYSLTLVIAFLLLLVGLLALLSIGARIGPFH